MYADRNDPVEEGSSDAAQYGVTEVFVQVRREAECTSADWEGGVGRNSLEQLFLAK